MMKLPEEFLKRMRQSLGEEFPAFLASYEDRPIKGVRLNPLKADLSILQKAFPVLTPSKFSPLSYAVEVEKLGDMPLHSAGAFYSQEPSAASAVTVLDPKPGDKVLDLCAAPGGKSTQIAALLNGEGLLWSNEIVRSRANILLSNIERMGVRNAVVSSCHPEQLCGALAGFFNKVLVDAPCSGEGMFRKNAEAVTEWSPEHVRACAQRQEAILHSAAGAVAQGGILVYSTCTFSTEENEAVCQSFLESHPEFSLAEPEVLFGRKVGGGLRILPMDGGEGHFVARFVRNDTNATYPAPFAYPSNSHPEGEALYRQLFFGEPFGPVFLQKDKLLLLPLGLPQLKGLSVLRAGVELGALRNGRIEPSHALFASQKAENCRNLLNLSQNDSRLLKYLHGEEIPCEEKGYTAVAVESVVLGFGKASGGVLKNRYPKGLRLR